MGRVCLAEKGALGAPVQNVRHNPSEKFKRSAKGKQSRQNSKAGRAANLNKLKCCKAQGGSEGPAMCP